MSTFIITDGRGYATSPAVGMPIGELINLDFVTKILWGNYFKTPTPDQTTTIYYFHGVPNGGTSSGGTTAYRYESVQVAQAVYNYMLAQFATTTPEAEIATDLRQQNKVFIDSVTPSSLAGGRSDPIYLTGDGFVNTGVVYIDGVACQTVYGALLPINQNCSFILDPSITAGTYDVIWTAPNGAYAVKLQSLTVT